MADNVPRVAEVSHLPPRYTAQYAAGDVSSDPLMNYILTQGAESVYSRMGGIGPPRYLPGLAPGLAPSDIVYMHQYGTQAIETARQTYLSNINPVQAQIGHMLHGTDLGRLLNKVPGPAMMNIATQNPTIQAIMGGDLMHVDNIAGNPKSPCSPLN